MQQTLMSAADTALVLIDVQEKLVATLEEPMRSRGVANCQRLLGAAHIFELPALVTEQYPRGLGHTLTPLSQALPPGAPVVEKDAFSGADALAEPLRRMGRKNVLLCGMETHVCVLFTAVDLIRRGFAVWTARDACMSRHQDNWHAGAHLMERGGATVVPTETLLFMLLGRSQRPEFKAVSSLLKTTP